MVYFAVLRRDDTALPLSSYAYPGLTPSDTPTADTYNKRRTNIITLMVRPLRMPAIGNNFTCHVVHNHQSLVRFNGGLRLEIFSEKPGGMLDRGLIWANYARLLTPTVSQIMNSSSVCRVLSATNPITVASSTKPSNGVMSGIKSNGSTK
jgi:hypothetical protein